VLAPFVACWSDALSWGCPARASGTVTVEVEVEVPVGRAGGVRPSSRWATDGACNVEVRSANMATNEFVSKEV